MNKLNVVKVTEFPTPLKELIPGLLNKFECDNPGSSHKARAAHLIVSTSVKSRKIIPGQTTIIEKTGGNFGFALAVFAQRLNVPTDQFSNPMNLEADECGTGSEIVAQLSAWPALEQLTFVGCAGTGASLTGISLQKPGMFTIR